MITFIDFIVYHYPKRQKAMVQNLPRSKFDLKAPHVTLTGRPPTGIHARPLDVQGTEAARVGRKS